MYGQLLTWLQRFDEARRQLEQFRKADPLSPWNDMTLIAWWGYQGQFGKELEDGERARARYPTLWFFPWQMGGAHLFLGRPDQAAADYEAALNVVAPARPAGVLAPLGLAYGLAGRKNDALAILAEMDKASRSRYVSPYSLP